uniref:Uncharacterized protein n=1 Tax=Erythrolobus australicus TaxID=1077150 RepID=A0A7S1XIR0_9RHOD
MKHQAEVYTFQLRVRRMIGRCCAVTTATASIISKYYFGVCVCERGAQRNWGERRLKEIVKLAHCAARCRVVATGDECEAVAFPPPRSKQNDAPRVQETHLMLQQTQ